MSARNLTFEFSIPQHMSFESIAKLFSVHLASPTSLFRIISAWEKAGSRGQAPPYQVSSSPQHWQLDDSNDYWLTEVPGGRRIQLACRHPSDRDICEAMITLLLRHSN